MKKGLDDNKGSLTVYGKFASFKVENPWLAPFTGTKVEKGKKENSLHSGSSFLFAFFLLMGKQKGCYPTLCIIDYQDIN